MNKLYVSIDTVKISQGWVQLLMKESIFSFPIFFPLWKKKCKISYLYTLILSYPLESTD